MMQSDVLPSAILTKFNKISRLQISCQSFADGPFIKVFPSNFCAIR